MATLRRRILDLVAAIGADIKALQAAVGSSGGGGSSALASISITPAECVQATRNVPVAGVAVGTPVQCWLVGNDDWEMDDLEGYSVHAVANTESIDFTVCAADLSPIVGNFAIRYRLG